jgi:hypothetical protein
MLSYHRIAARHRWTARPSEDRLVTREPPRENVGEAAEAYAGRTAYATQSQHGVTETPSRKSFTDTVEE